MWNYFSALCLKKKNDMDYKDFYIREVYIN